MSLLSRWDNDSLPAWHPSYQLTYNDIWGWANPEDGREYAIIGALEYTFFIDITDPYNPVLIDSVQGGCPTCYQKDIKTYRNYAYISLQSAPTSLQIADLSYLPDSVHLVYDSNVFFPTAHNIYIDDESGRLYVAEDNAGLNRMVVLDIASNPEQPQLLATSPLNTTFHDIHVKGDTLYGMRNQYGYNVYDYRQVQSPQLLYNLNTPGSAQRQFHSSWLAQCDKLLVIAEEKWGLPLRIENISDFNQVDSVSIFASQLQQHPDSTKSIPHNPFVLGNYVFVSYYHDGVQVFDISNPAQPTQIAWYDTYQETSYNGFAGCWGVYPYLPSGNIIASDIQNGLYVIQPGFPLDYPLETSLQVTDVSCTGAQDGSIAASIMGCSAPYSYHWSTGDTTSSISGLPAGTYTLTIRDKYQHEIKDTVEITTTSTTPLAQFSYTTNQAQASFTNDSRIATAYFWDFGDGSTDTATNPIHTYAAQGTYEVCLIATNSCGSDTICQTVTIIILSQEMPRGLALEVSPVPADEVLEITLGKSFSGKWNLQITGIDGKSYYKNTSLNDKIVLSTQGLASGIYLLEVSYKENKYYRKLLIQH